MSYLQACVLGLIQGLTEFLPVSSSAHLALAPRLFGWPDHGQTFDVALHIGTLFAIAGYFTRDWIAILDGSLRRSDGPQRKLFIMLVIASIPAAFVGLAFEKTIESSFRSPSAIAVLLIVFGFLLWVADRFGARARTLEQFTWAGALIVGCAQALALLPGVSRSGVTITAALILGLTREASARFSFLMATPIVVGAGLLKLRHLTADQITGPFAVGVLVSALTGLAAVHFFLTRLPRSGLLPYAVYRALLGAGILAWAWAR